MIECLENSQNERRPEREPFAIVVDHEAGFAFRVDLELTRRQQVLLRYLVANMGCAVPERLLFLLGAALTDDAQPPSITDDLTQLADQLAAAVGRRILRQTRDGAYLLSNDTTRIEIPRA